MTLFERKLAALESRKAFINGLCRDYSRERARLKAYCRAIELAFEERTGREPPDDGEVFWNEADEVRADELVLALYPEADA